jgi:phosphoribosyl-ATP pyrophosphohydrolase
MIIPSIDLQHGRAVQLKRGSELLLIDERDPVSLAAEFGRYGPIAIVDLDAAMGQGENSAIIRDCCRVARCRVGGGIRTEQQVRDTIRFGADKVMIGTCATPEFLKPFPGEWIVACLDAKGTEVVVDGWRERTHDDLFDRAERLAPFCSEFLFTQVNVEGTLAGPDLETARELASRTKRPITVAGGIRGTEDFEQLEALGCNGQIGRALYEGKMDLTESWISLLRYDASGLIPVVVEEAGSARTLMLAYANRESMRTALQKGCGAYWSRSRQELWIKGATSGNRQRLVEARWDCDRDAVLFRVEQTGPACHRGEESCFRSPAASELLRLERTLEARQRSNLAGSYSAKLIADAQLLDAKLREETEEVIEAEEQDHLQWECADLLYHLMVRMRARGLALSDIESELRARGRGEAE